MTPSMITVAADRLIQAGVGEVPSFDCALRFKIVRPGTPSSVQVAEDRSHSPAMA